MSPRPRRPSASHALAPPAKPPAPADAEHGWVRAGENVGTTMVADLISATLVWAGIGWLVDRWLGSGPWLMVGGLLLGHALGFYSLWLRSAAVFASGSDPVRGTDGRSPTTDAAAVTAGAPREHP